MSGLSYGIGGFVSGLVQGAEIRNGWADRKRRQQIEDEDRALQKEDRTLRLEDRQRRIALEEESLGWKRADRAYLQSEREREQAERDREEADRKEREAVNKKAHEDTRRSIERKRDAASQPAQTTGAPGAAPQPPGAAASERIPGRMPRGGATTLSAGPQAPIQPNDAVAAPPAVDPAIAPERSREPTEQPMPPWSIHRAGRGRVDSTQPAAAPQPGPAPSLGAGAPLTPPAPGVAPSNAPRGIGARQPALPAPEAPGAAPKAPLPSASPTGELPVTPSVELVVEKTRGIGGRRGGDDQITSFLDEYRRVGAPQIVEHMIAKGDIEGAKSFQSWIDDEEIKEGQKLWARGVQAATLGDDEGFFENMVGAYNATGYFDDGFEAVPDKSGLTRGEDGNVTGAYITFRNQDTGQENRVDYEDISDLYEMGIMALSPEAVFEHGMEQLKAADEARASALEHQRAIELEEVKASLKGSNSDQKAIDSELEELRRTDMTGQFSMLPIEEQIAKAISSIEAKRAAIGAFGAPQRSVVAGRGE